MQMMRMMMMMTTMVMTMRWRVLITQVPCAHIVNSVRYVCKRKESRKPNLMLLILLYCLIMFKNVKRWVRFWT